MFNSTGILKKIFGSTSRQKRTEVLEKQQLDLDEQEVETLEKALKFYIFCRQQSSEDCSEEIKKRLKHSGHVAFSMIITFLEEREFKLEYMQFINSEWVEYVQAEAKFSPLTIPPSEIEKIELREQARFQFADRETGKLYNLRYRKAEKSCEYVIMGREET